MNYLQTILSLIFLVIVSSHAYSQGNSASHKLDVEIPEVALLGMVSSGQSTIDLKAISPVEAGSSIDFSDSRQEEMLWINYTSVIKNNSHRRKIVALVQGEIPAGVQLKVEASEATGDGRGQRGSSMGIVTLSGQPSEIITNIGSCYTGTGANNGHFLTYKLDFDKSANNFAQLTRAQTTLSVVYTLTDLN